jgi:transposase
MPHGAWPIAAAHRRGRLLAPHRGHLLAQQLLAAGERVLDVPPKLGARVRLLASGDVNKNDPNDARSVAVAALRSAGVREARADDHAAVLKIWSKRYRDLGRSRTQVVCRLHAVLCELVPGGVSKAITAGQAAQVLGSIMPPDAVAAARCELAAAFIDDLRGIDARIRETRKKLAAAVQAAGTSLTGLFGVGPVVAAAVLGDVRDVSRFGGRDRFAAYNGTAPIEVSSGQRKVYRLSRRGNRRLNHAIHMVAVTQIRHRHSEGRAYYDKKLAEGKTPKEALRALKRQISNAIFACLQADAHRAAARAKDPGGQQGNDSDSSAAGSHPRHRLFGQATPVPGHHTTTAASTPAPQHPGLPGAGRAIPQSLPLCRRRRRRSRWSARFRYLESESGCLRCKGAGVLCAFSCVVDALPGQCLRRTPGANPLVAAVFRTKRLLRERCSATCQRRRRPGQARHGQGRLQITA